ncbi:MAG: hypothetical protein KAG19_08730 [Methylococcales bacterium]|nr:hypothetical protein [Methylococcales bacterium]
MRHRKYFLLSAVSCAFLSGCTTTGTGRTALSGSAGGSTSVDANPSLERCSETLGTLAVDDGRNADWYGRFGSSTKITTIEPLIRLAVQQSNCFVITSIGNQKMDERMTRITDKQRNSGEYRAGSKQQKGQRVAADYYLEPQIIIDDSAVGKLATSLGGVLSSVVGGTMGQVAHAITGNMGMKSSVVTLTLSDVRSAIQISISEGSSTATNYGAAMSGFGGGMGGGLSGFTKTPSGKATVAAFLDAYNGMVISLKNYKAQDVKGGLGRGGSLKVN